MTQWSSLQVALKQVILSLSVQSLLCSEEVVLSSHYFNHIVCVIPVSVLMLLLVDNKYLCYGLY